MDSEVTELNKELLELSSIFKQNVKLWCFENNTSLRELASLAGIKYHTLWNCFNKDEMIVTTHIWFGIYKITGIRLID